MQTEPIISENSKTCQYPPCSKHFVPAKKNQKYCSDGCRARDSSRRKVMSEMQAAGQPIPGAAPVPQISKPGQVLPLFFEKPAPKAEIQTPKGMDIGTQYVIDAQKKEIDRWESAWKEEREKRKKLAEDKAKVEKELQDLKTDLKIAEVAKPSGLQGFMENPFIKELAPHMGPVLAGIVAKLVTPALPMEGQAEVQQDPTAVWVSQQPVEVQNALRAVIHEVAKMGEPEKMIQALDRMRNIAKGQPGGNVIHNNGPIRATGTFGI